ncbi:hypothetical protein LWI28_001982 [Acer negundo]|uniref:Uncharacterized protein n=1 Tax=Acer negundo TaxID=4023 RepID=A0AAD5NZ34_ACENE|nr:hypothetical protein LWI28_001982 [Acer negundo]
MAPALVLHPPPPPPEFKQFRIVNENGTMSDEFEIGEYDPDLVEMNWGNENGRVAPEVGGLARRALAKALEFSDVGFEKFTIASASCLHCFQKTQQEYVVNYELTALNGQIGLKKFAGLIDPFSPDMH